MGTSQGPEGEVFNCLCSEPEGDVLRSVRLFKFDSINLNKLWFRASKFPTLMGREINSFQDMLKIFVDEGPAGEIIPKGLCLVVDDFVGIFWLTDIQGLHEASVHYTFFDRRHKGRVELCKKAIRYAYSTFGFHRLWTQVPISAGGVLTFVESLGFQKAGRLRKSTYFKGKYYDTNVYDLLREEYLDGNFNGKDNRVRSSERSDSPVTTTVRSSEST